jgi:hypothetical protein
VKRRGAGRTAAAGGLLLAALAAGIGRAAAQGAASQSSGGLRMGIAVRPETVSVGQPFTVTVRVQAPSGATVTFPEGPAPDSSAPLEALDPRSEQSTPSAGVVDRTATYRLVAWTPGAMPIALGDVIVRQGVAEQRLPVRDASVVVGTVLPADTTLRVPRAAQWILETPAPWWWPWLPMALGALALAGLAWWLWRRKRTAHAPAEDPFDAAERAFARLEALGLLEAGERGRFVALAVEVLREYLARTVPQAALSLTSEELLALVRRERELPTDRLGVVLGESDLIKFARRPVSFERARELGREARAILREAREAHLARTRREARAGIAQAAAPAGPEAGRAA